MDTSFVMMGEVGSDEDRELQANTNPYIYVVFCLLIDVGKDSRLQRKSTTFQESSIFT